MINLDLLQALCAVPTQSNHEERMTSFLWGYCVAKGWQVERDRRGSLRVTKRLASSSLMTHLPAVCAHIDSVQPIREVTVARPEEDIIIARDKDGKQVGFGADDKTGVAVCLELLDRVRDGVAFFFVGEEIGMLGAQEAPKPWFDDIGYIIEFDCPARYMVSYSVGGVRLFKNKSKFANIIVPVLTKHGYTHWQAHPYTDVKKLRQRFPISCLNLASGYYNWHSRDEYVRISEVAASATVGHDLLQALGCVKYRCPVNFDEAKDGPPAIKVEGLRVIDEHAKLSRPPLSLAQPS